MVDVVAIKLIVAVNQWATMGLVVASIVVPRPDYMNEDLKRNE
jgi:hypothetical protein